MSFFLRGTNLFWFLIFKLKIGTFWFAATQPKKSEQFICNRLTSITLKCFSLILRVIQSVYPHISIKDFKFFLRGTNLFSFLIFKLKIGTFWFAATQPQKSEQFICNRLTSTTLKCFSLIWRVIQSVYPHNSPFNKRFWVFS